MDASNPTATFANNTVAGNTYVVVIGVDFNFGDISGGPTDTEGGNTYVLKLGGMTSPTGRVKQYIWVAQNVTGGTHNAISVGTTNGAVASLFVLELSNSHFMDQAAQQAQLTNSTADGVTSPTVTTTVATELLLGLGSTHTADNGFTITGTGWVNIARGTQEIEQQSVTSIGSYAATTATGTATESVMGIITFANAPQAAPPITLNPQTVAAGYTSVGTVGLAAPAPAGGATVTLSSSNTAVATVPGSVLVPAGSTSATFTVNTSSVSSSTLVNISATYNSTTNVATLAVVPVNASPQYSIWSSSATPVVSDDGGTSAVEVGVKFSADTSGFISGIRFFKSAANTGTQVGNLWTSTGQLLATATFTGETASGWQSVNFSSPILLTANTVYVASYHTNTGHTSDDQTYFTNIGVDNSPLHAPASGVSGGNGVRTFSAGSVFPNTTSLDSNYWVDVAFIASSSPHPLQGLTLNPANMTGGSTSTGTVTLSAAAPVGGTTVALSSDNTNVSTIPSSVTIPEGSTTASFAVTTHPVAVSTVVTITATLNGTATARLTVNPPTLLSVSVHPTSAIGGHSVTGRVMLNAAAPAGGALVTLSSNNAAAVVPVGVTVAAGSTSQSFSVSTSPVQQPASAKITATYGTGTQNATLTLIPHAGNGNGHKQHDDTKDHRREGGSFDNDDRHDTDHRQGEKEHDSKRR